MAIHSIVIKCPDCGSPNVRFGGPRNGKQRIECKEEDCGRWFNIPLDMVDNTPTIKSAPRILLFDLETSRIEVRSKVFSLWEQNLNPKDIIRDWIILCFSAKWLYDGEVMSYACSQKDIKNWDDKSVVEELWHLLNQADIVIAHNAPFDVKHSTTRFVYHDYSPPSQYKVVDTLRMARGIMSCPSNKLDYLGTLFGLGNKIQNEQGLWDKVETWNHPEWKNAMANMRLYCNQDVLLLEKIYLKLRPYYRNNPNLSLYGESEDGYTCPCCGQAGMIEWDEENLFENRYQRGRCGICTAPIIGRDNKMSKEKRKLIVRR